jgi:hypothetical protein
MEVQKHSYEGDEEKISAFNEDVAKNENGIESRKI